LRGKRKGSRKGKRRRGEGEDMRRRGRDGWKGGEG